MKFKLADEESKIKSNSKNENQTQKIFQSHNYFKFFDPKILIKTDCSTREQSKKTYINED